MTIEQHPARTHASESRSVLYFHETPVLELEAWLEGDKLVIHAPDLELRATGTTEAQVVEELGEMVLNLVDLLLQQRESLSEDERRRLDSLLERLAPAVVRQYRRERGGDLLYRVRGLLRPRRRDWELAYQDHGEQPSLA